MDRRVKNLHQTGNLFGDELDTLVYHLIAEDGDRWRQLFYKKKFVSDRTPISLKQFQYLHECCQLLCPYNKMAIMIHLQMFKIEAAIVFNWFLNVVENYRSFCLEFESHILPIVFGF